MQIRNVYGTGIETPYISTKYFYIYKYRSGVMLATVKDKRPVFILLFVYSCINSQVQGKASLSLPIKSTSLHLNSLSIIVFNISAQALVLLKAWIFLDSNNLGFLYGWSDAKMSMHSRKTL